MNITLSDRDKQRLAERASARGDHNIEEYVRQAIRYCIWYDNRWEETPDAVIDARAGDLP